MEDSANTGQAPQALAETSDELTALLERRLGQSPAETEVHAHDGLVVCVMRDTATALERQLNSSPDARERVRGARRALQDGLGPEARAIVERRLGRRVTSYLSDYDGEADAVAIAFLLDGAVLHPVDEGGDGDL